MLGLAAAAVSAPVAANACEPRHLSLFGNLWLTALLASLFDIPDMATHPTYEAVASPSAFSPQVTVYDSNGVSHVVTFSFYHVMRRIENVRPVVDGREIIGGTAGMPAAAGPDFGFLFFWPGGERVGAGSPDVLLIPAWKGSGGASIRVLAPCRQTDNARVLTFGWQDGMAGSRSRGGGLDFDGDGIDDSAIWRKKTGFWAIPESASQNTTTLYRQWGFAHLPVRPSGDRPIRGDSDGDGLLDLAIWRPKNGEFSILASGSGARFNCVNRRSDVYSVRWSRQQPWCSARLPRKLFVLGGEEDAQTWVAVRSGCHSCNRIALGLRHASAKPHAGGDGASVLSSVPALHPRLGPGRFG